MAGSISKCGQFISFILSTTFPAYISAFLIYNAIYKQEIKYFEQVGPILLVTMTISMLIILFIYRYFIRDEIINLRKNKRKLWYIPGFFAAENIIFSLLSTIDSVSADNENEKTVEEFIDAHKITAGLMVGVVGPVLEEFCYRKFLFADRRRKKSFRSTIRNRDFCGFMRLIVILLVSSLIFGYMHVPTDFSISKVSPYFTAGVLLALICDFSGLLILSIFTHSLSNIISMLMLFN